MRILHAVTIMNRGGIESWLMQILRNIDRRKYQFDFLVHRNEPGCFDEEIKSLGSKIIPIASANRPLSHFDYLKDFRRILAEYGPYDAVHCHGGPFLGPLLRQAKLADVPMRIMHSHNLQQDWRGGPLRAIAGWIGNLMIKKYANV
ncbi:MAG: glycosyltransferase, partial [Planctomycetota bacterium]